MNTLALVKQEGYDAGLAGRIVSRSIWLDSTEFGRAYQEGWMEGALAATAPAPGPVETPGTVRAFG